MLQSPSSLRSSSSCPTISQRSPSLKRRVSMSKDVLVRTYDASSNAKRKNKLWYSADEIQEQRKRDLKIVDMIRQRAEASQVSTEELTHVVHSLSEDTRMNIRGLETLLDHGEQKSRNKLRGIMAVLTEQDRQDFEGRLDDYDIAQRYMGATLTCQEEAYKRALMDRAALNFNSDLLKNILRRVSTGGNTSSLQSNKVSPSAA